MPGSIYLVIRLGWYHIHLYIWTYIIIYKHIYIPGFANRYCVLLLSPQFFTIIAYNKIIRKKPLSFVKKRIFYYMWINFLYCENHYFSVVRKVSLCERLRYGWKFTGNFEIRNYRTNDTSNVTQRVRVVMKREYVSPVTKDITHILK